MSHTERIDEILNLFPTYISAAINDGARQFRGDHLQNEVTTKAAIILKAINMFIDCSVQNMKLITCKFIEQSAGAVAKDIADPPQFWRNQKMAYICLRHDNIQFRYAASYLNVPIQNELVSVENTNKSARIMANSVDRQIVDGQFLSDVVESCKLVMYNTLESRYTGRPKINCLLERLKPYVIDFLQLLESYELKLRNGWYLTLFGCIQELTYWFGSDMPYHEYMTESADIDIDPSEAPHLEIIVQVIREHEVYKTLYVRELFIIETLLEGFDFYSEDEQDEIFDCVMSVLLDLRQVDPAFSRFFDLIWVEADDNIYALDEYDYLIDELQSYKPAIDIKLVNQRLKNAQTLCKDHLPWLDCLRKSIKCIDWLKDKDISSLPKQERGMAEEFLLYSEIWSKFEAEIAQVPTLFNYIGVLSRYGLVLKSIYQYLLKGGTDLEIVIEQLKFLLQNVRKSEKKVRVKRKSHYKLKNIANQSDVSKDAPKQSEKSSKKVVKQSKPLKPPKSVVSLISVSEFQFLSKLQIQELKEYIEVNFDAGTLPSRVASAHYHYLAHRWSKSTIEDYISTAKEIITPILACQTYKDMEKRCVVFDVHFVTGEMVARISTDEFLLVFTFKGEILTFVDRVKNHLRGVPLEYPHELVHKFSKLSCK